MDDAACPEPGTHLEAASARVGPTKFTLRGTELLSSGQTTIFKAGTGNLWLHSKVYSRGGENALHAHPREDHMFFVLQGAATFHFGDGASQAVGQWEGVLVPKGVLYRFVSEGSDNLVMLRIGAAQRGDDWSGETTMGFPIELCEAVDENGETIFDNNSLRKGKTPSEPAIPIPGRYFPER